MTRRAAALALAVATAVAASCGDAGPDAAHDTPHDAARDPAATEESVPGDAPRPTAKRAARPDEPEPFSLATSEPPPLPATARGLADLLVAEPDGPRTFEIMRELDAMGEDALPELIRMSRVPELAGWACNRIGIVGKGTPEAVAAVVACIRDDRAGSWAAWPLSELGDAGLAAAAALIDDPDPLVRTIGFDVVTFADRTPPVVLQAVLRAARSPDANSQGRAVEALCNAPLGDPAVTDALLRLAQSGDPKVRTGAVGSIAERGADFADRGEILVRIAESGAVDMDLTAYAIVSAGPDATLLALASPSEAVRAAVAERCDPEDDRIGERVVALLRDDAAPVREAALRTLAKLAEPPQVVTETTIELLRAGADAATRTAAAVVAGRVLAKGGGTLEPLLAALSDPSPEVRTAAAVALAEGCAPADRTRVLEAIRPLWERDDLPGMHYGRRVPIAAAAGALEGEGTATVALLARCAMSRDEAAFRGLARVGTRDAVAELLSWLDTVRWNERLLAIAALGEVRTADDRIVPALLKELATAPRTGVRAAAAKALTRHRDDAKVREALIAAWKSQWKDVAAAARSALRDD